MNNQQRTAERATFRANNPLVPSGKAPLGLQPLAATLMMVGYLALLGVGGCGSSAESDRVSSDQAALTHAADSADFQRLLAALKRNGWSIRPIADATVEHLQPSAASDHDAANADLAVAPVTRVTVSASSSSGASAALSAKVRLFWSADSVDHVAVTPDNSSARAEIVKTLEQVAVASESDSAIVESSVSSNDDIGVTRSALSCDGIGASCTGNRTCCYGLSCHGPDNHETCHCSDSWSTEYPSGATLNFGCVGQDNPFGEGYWLRFVSGCGHNGLVSDLCGRTRAVPAYITGSYRFLICEAGGPC